MSLSLQACFETQLRRLYSYCGPSNDDGESKDGRCQSDRVAWLAQYVVKS